MNGDRRALGARVEALARASLSRAGLLDIATNANYRVGEIDLVMRDGDTLVFVEVRYRRDARYGGAGASVDTGKRRRIVAAAGQFLAAHRVYRDWPCRFDVVVASGNAEAPDLQWLRDAFRADDC